MRILIVEDEKEIADGLAGILKGERFLTDTVYDGEEGLDYIRTNMYEMILLDVMLPNMNGFEIVKKIRAGNRNACHFPDGKVPSGRQDSGT